MGERMNHLDIEDIIVVGMDSHTTAVQEKLKAVQGKMLNEGMHNGSHGIVILSEELEKRATIQAESCHSELKVLIKHTLGKLKSSLEFAKLIFEKSEKKFNALHWDLSYFSLVKSNSTNSQSVVAICALLSLGFFLILADIALALQLVMVGFIFPEPKIKAFGIDRLMTSAFFDVLKSNWQVFFTTIGIATFTIILKITFDRFIGTPYGDGYVKKSIFERWFGDNQTSVINYSAPITNENQDVKKAIDEDLKRIKKYERFKNGIFITLAIFTIIFLFFLAQFRGFSMNLEELKNKQKIELTDLYALKANSDEINKITKEHNEKLGEETNKGAINRTIIFFGTTLLFPIVSAICFSIAGAAIENKRKIRLLNKEVESIKKVIEEDNTTLKNAKGEFEAWSLEEKFIELEVFRQDFKKKLIDIYKYGFTIGNTRPDLFQRIPDLLNTVEKYRDKTILYKTNQKLTRFKNEAK